MMTTWRKELEQAFIKTKDSWETLQITLSEEELNKEFEDGAGEQEGNSFYAWSDNWVYFVNSFDGMERVDYIPRNPTSQVKPYHHGY